MAKKRMAAFAMAFVLAVGLCPAMAFAAPAGDLHAGALTVVAQESGTDLSDCTIEFTDKNHRSDHGDENSTYKVYFVKGKNAVAKPSFDLYLGGKLVPKDAYTVQYQLSWYNDEEGEDVLVDVTPAQLTPSRSPEANSENMASEYRIVVTAKDGSGYTGTFQSNENRFVAICVADWYNVGRYMDCYLARAKSDWQYNINPMNGNYFVIPQAKAKAVLGSLTLRANCSPADGGMLHDGTKVAAKYYSVTYYRAKKNAVEDNMSPASAAKTGKALKSMPTAAGSYVMIIKGKSPYYGNDSILFDIQGSMSDVKIAKVASVRENGKERKPHLTVTYKGTELKEGVDYEVEYKNNVKAGTATAIVTGAPVVTNVRGDVRDVDTARFFTGSKKVTFRIAKNPNRTWKANPMKATAQSITVKANKLIKRGNVKVSSGNAFKVSGDKGAVTYKKISGSGLISVSSKGVVTVMQHAGFAFKGDTLTAKVRVSDKGTSKYYAKSQVVTLKVKIA